MKFKIIFFFILISVLFSISIIYLLFENKKNTFIEKSTKKKIEYEIKQIDKKFLKIEIPEETINNEIGYFNKFKKKEFKTLTVLIETQKCSSEYIFILTRYNNSVYSNIIKLASFDEDLYVNLHYSKDDLNFLHFEIHENNINCIKELYHLQSKKNKVPFYHYIVTKNKKKNFNKINSSELFSIKNFEEILKDKNLKIVNHQIAYWGNTMGKDGESLFLKYYFKMIRKPFLINDIFIGRINSSVNKDILIKCKLVKGNVFFSFI